MLVAPGAFWSSWHPTWVRQGVSTSCPACLVPGDTQKLTGRAVTQQAGNAGRYQQLLPGHQAAEAGPGGFADEEPHHGVRDGIPHSSRKQDDGGIESVHLQEEELESGICKPPVLPAALPEPLRTIPATHCDLAITWEQPLGLSPSFGGI